MLSVFSRLTSMTNISQRRRVLSLLAIFMAGLLAVSLPAVADPRDKLDRIRDQKERVAERREELDDRGDRLARRIERLDARRAGVEARVHELDETIRSLDDKIVDAKVDLEREQRKLALLTRDLQDILRALNDRTDAFTERAVATYVAGPSAYMDSLLTSGTFNDLVTRYEYYESALNADSELLAEIEVLRDGTESRRDLILEKEHAITVTKRNLEADRLALAEAREVSAEVLAQREEVLSEKEVLLADIEASKQEALALYNELDQNSDAIEALILARQQAAAAAAARAAREAAGEVPGPAGPVTPSVPDGGGQLLWPTSGPLTSPYGYRTHPIFGDRRLHTGIDIGAPYGAAVFAADAGVVSYAGVMSGYGNVVVVDHGGGLATTYNHLAGFTVGTEQTVGRGTQIGNVGCSGYCTGPHLHFEVRVDGAPVDPMPYLQ